MALRESEVLPCKALLYAIGLLTLGACPALAADKDPVIPIGGSFELVTHEGRSVTEKSFPEKFLLVFFGYTFCPDICPTTLQQVSTVLDSLGAGAERIQPLFITVDPKRDTAAVLKDYVGHFHPSIVGLTGTSAQVTAATKAYRAGATIVPDENGDPDNYLVHHSAFLYLMGPEGGLRAIMLHIMPPEAIAQQIQRQLDKST